MEFKGTKGKWNIHNDNEIGILVGGYNPISDVCTIHRYGDKIEENANAKLIASAPEMFEMLKRIENTKGNIAVNDAIWIEMQQLLTKITE